MLEILRESGGAAISVKDEEMLEAQIEFGKIEGIFTSPEGAATLVALNKLLSNRFIKRGESVVVFITASGVKYIE
jgi:threonine synthase